MMATIRDLLVWGTKTLMPVSQESARLEAQLLLAHVLDTERSTLYGYPERVVTAEQERLFRSLVEQRSLGEPLAYLVGHREFYGLDFLVDRRVLIPRPETELLVDAALRAIRLKLSAGQMPVVADIGTGSGAIPITLAVSEPRLPYLYACDISAEALEVARLNCQQHRVEARVCLLQGDLLAPLPEPVDVLTANLPYVGTAELDVIAPDVYAYEPHLALFSGPDGLDLLVRFCTQAQQSAILKAGAVMLLEIGYRQKEPLTQLLHELWPQAAVTSLSDYAGWQRIVQITL
jgi:release factor glutamine methyltransferase